jgi:hypothetical protein
VEGGSVLPSVLTPALPAPPSVDPYRPLLAQLRERGDMCRSGTSLLVGYDANGQPLSIELSEWRMRGGDRRSARRHAGQLGHASPTGPTD